MDEKEKIFMEGLETTTGKGFMEWVACIEQANTSRLGDIVKYLQEKHGLEYRVAHTLTHLYLKHREENAATISYTSAGRAGKVIYRKKDIHFEMDWEFGGGNCIAFIFIPNESRWEKETGTPLSERKAILDFIGQQVLKDQTSGRARYEIEGDFLNIISQ